jgi:hypothetical protein
MFARLFFGICAVLAAGSLAAAQTPIDHNKILALAKAGKADEAWKAWDALPKSVERSRFGVTLAVETKRIARGIEVYDALTAALGAPEPKSLTVLALGVAADLAGVSELDARVTACAAAVRLDPKHAACRRALEAVAQSKTSLDEQALVVYTLANYGERPWPGLFPALETGMSKNMRLRVAQTMTRLPAAERFALVRGLAEDPDSMTRYQIVLLFAEIPGRDVAGTLRNLQLAPPPTMGGMNLPGLDPVKDVLPLALARHGDDAGLQAARTRLPKLAGVEKLVAGQALAEAKDNRGILALQELAASAVDIERLTAAKALAPYDLETSKRIVRAALTGSPANWERALAIAGSLKLGTESVVYKRLAENSPGVRAAAVAAIADTLAR